MVNIYKNMLWHSSFLLLSCRFFFFYWFDLCCRVHKSCETNIWKIYILMDYDIMCIFLSIYVYLKCGKLVAFMLLFPHHFELSESNSSDKNIEYKPFFHLHLFLSLSLSHSQSSTHTHICPEEQKKYDEKNVFFIALLYRINNRFNVFFACHGLLFYLQTNTLGSSLENRKFYQEKSPPRMWK